MLEAEKYIAQCCPQSNAAISIQMPEFTRCPICKGSKFVLIEEPVSSGLPDVTVSNGRLPPKSKFEKKVVTCTACSGSGQKQTRSVTWTFHMEGVAWALGPVDKPASMLVLRKYGTGTESDEDKILMALFRIVKKISIQKNWNFKGIIEKKGLAPDLFIYKLCQVALSEALSNRQCSRCEGKGYFIDEKRDPPAQECRACDQSGTTQWNNSQRAELVGMDRKNFKANWSRRYITILGILINWEQEALNTMYDRITGRTRD